MDLECDMGSRNNDWSKRFLAALALSRLTAGVVSLTRPAVMAKGLGVDSGSARRTGFVTRMFGSREIGLGLGTLYAARRGGPALSPWLVASLLADSLDAVALVAAARNEGLAPVRSYALAAGAAAAATGTAVTLWTLRSSRSDGA